MIRHQLMASSSSILIVSGNAIVDPPMPLARHEVEFAEIERFLVDAQVVERWANVDGEEQACFANMSDGQVTMTLVIQTIRPYRYDWFRSRDSYSSYDVAVY